MKITIPFFLIFGIILIGLYIPSYNGTQKTYSCKMHTFIDLHDGQIVPQKKENFGFSLSEGSFWFKTKI